MHRGELRGFRKLQSIGQSLFVLAGISSSPTYYTRQNTARAFLVTSENSSSIHPARHHHSSTSTTPPTVCSSSPNIMIPAVDPPRRTSVIEAAGGRIRALESSIGAVVYGMDLTELSPSPPSQDLKDALEQEMAHRGFLVFKNQKPNMTIPQELAAARWWGTQQLHSTHGVHPAVPQNSNNDNNDNNNNMDIISIEDHHRRHIFRLSNDPKHGILGVGPQWHNDGSFVDGTFSHVGYRIIQAPQAGGTHFCHQGAAFDALPPDRKDFWERLVSVNSNSGVAHPAVHVHPISQRKSVWLHLGMTGAVIERIVSPPPPDNAKAAGGATVETESGDGDGAVPPQFRLLDQFEMKTLFHEYNNLLNKGMSEGYGIAYEYEEGDFLFIDNLAVAHRASPEAHLPPQQVGLRILHRTTIRAEQDFLPPFGLPLHFDIHDQPPPSPLLEVRGKSTGVWIGGGVGFRWDDSIHMQN